jgi:type IV pilus assembly protein PilW
MTRAVRPARGFTLLELLVALVIGLTLIAAFLVVLQRVRGDLTAGENLAALQESARHALAVIADDIEHAGFYGFGGGRVQLPASLPPGAQDCGPDFALDLLRVAQGSDNHYAMGDGALDCAPTATAGGAAATADTLTLRHASLGTAPPKAGRLQVYSTARASQGALVLFADGRAPGPVDDEHEIRDLEVRSFYVANDSVGRRGRPALRVKSLTESRGAAQFRDEEIMPGVEDLQVEFLVSSDEGGAAQVRYLPAGSPHVESARIIAVRFWLRLSAHDIERGHLDARTLRYANTAFTPDAREAGRRRLLVERTVALRNTRP